MGAAKSARKITQSAPSVAIQTATAMRAEGGGRHPFAPQAEECPQHHRRQREAQRRQRQRRDMRGGHRAKAERPGHQRRNRQHRGMA